MKKTFLPKQEYRKIKKLTREEMDEYFIGVYQKGFRAGAESANNADFKIKLVQVLNKTKGIGNTLFDRILENSKEVE